MKNTPLCGKDTKQNQNNPMKTTYSLEDLSVQLNKQKNTAKTTEF